VIQVNRNPLLHQQDIYHNTTLRLYNAAFLSVLLYDLAFNQESLLLTERIRQQGVLINIQCLLAEVYL